MSDIKREHPDGDYVLYSDHAALIAKRDAEIARLKALVSRLEERVDHLTEVSRNPVAAVAAARREAFEECEMIARAWDQRGRGVRSTGETK